MIRTRSLQSPSDDVSFVVIWSCRPFSTSHRSVRQFCGLSVRTVSTRSWVRIPLGSIFQMKPKKYFQKNHKYHNIFNKNNMKVSYSCMDNRIKIINSHNKYVASKKDQANQNLFNCQNLDNCQLGNKYITSKIV